MVRYAEARVTPLYEAAEQIVDQALRADGSLFTPGAPIWTKDNIREFYHRFIEQPDTGTDPFEVKLQRQLQDAPPAVIQLAAEMLFIHLLIIYPSAMGGAAKRNLINRVLSWGAGHVSLPADLDKALDAGTSSPGTFYLTDRPGQVRLLIEFAQKWKGVPLAEREEALSDPWKFKALIESMSLKSSSPQIAVLLYLVFPDTFEAIVSYTHKQEIAKHLANFGTETSGDLDRQLFSIRQALSARYGDGFSFYSSDVKPLWSMEKKPWDRFIAWGKRFFAWEGLDAEERDYKLQIARNLKAAREALVAGSNEWPTLLQNAFKKPNNLTDWRLNAAFSEWFLGNRETAEVALGKFWDENTPVEERIRVFTQEVPKDAYKGTGSIISSFLLMGEDPFKYPIFRRMVYEKGYSLTGYPAAPKNADSAETYMHGLAFLDSIVEHAEAMGLQLRDRLDAQALLWCVVRWDIEEEPVKSWPEQDKEALVNYRGGFVDEQLVDGRDYGVDGDNTSDTLQVLADKLFMDKTFLQRVEKLIVDKGQVVFYGPPGTGKTYVAQKLGEYYAGAEGTVEIVQFHPSYAYEDFVEGYRPNTEGQGFSLVAGPLKKIAKAARVKPNARHVLVIDEINRGNVAKVFGELYFLLEYRDKRVALQYSGGDGEGFSLPPNLWIIGTMNTADRSIALIDAALRRRFYFVPFFPDERPVSGVLRKWLARHKSGMEWVADVVDEANRKMGARHAAIGPSYFMRDNLSDEWMELIWEHAVMPYLAERFYGDEDRLTEYDLKKLQEAVKAKIPMEPTGDNATDGAHPDAAGI